MRILAAPVATLALLLSSLTAAHPADATPAAPAAAEDAPRRATNLKVTVVARGLANPWDVRPIGNGRLLVTQRDSAKLTLVRPNGRKRNLAFPSGKVWNSGETGLMGLAVDPGFADNRRIYTCQGWRLGGGRKDIRVISWQLDKRLTRAKQVRVLVRGLPTVTGRHGGCRLLIARNGSLLVGTGDAAVGRNPQSLRSLGGKTLRVNRFTGRAWPTNPWAKADGPRRLIFTYGHRNVQGARPAGRRLAVVGRARQPPRRRGQPAPSGRQLRLEPGARLQRVRAADRPLAARQAGQRPLAFRHPDDRDLRCLLRAARLGPPLRHPRGGVPRRPAADVRQVRRQGPPPVDQGTRAAARLRPAPRRDHGRQVAAGDHVQRQRRPDPPGAAPLLDPRPTQPAQPTRLTPGRAVRATARSVPAARATRRTTRAGRGCRRCRRRTAGRGRRWRG
ncbi:PQQ-dependent sugar dehydrogenase [Nocardioides sp. TF02-7]|uniref:PQQ-dependent sugar dehydrogenase n=1 Tax=Nocardioides sp. TF02-7 TaxID=2917724 RepID=UPI0023DCD55A|nr:PQQ-dependent sugar dehydrogenase [Nocardioides sp. TF02-7]